MPDKDNIPGQMELKDFIGEYPKGEYSTPWVFKKQFRKESEDLAA